VSVNQLMVLRCLLECNCDTAFVTLGFSKI
jgi:hypothetical protein